MTDDVTPEPVHDDTAKLQRWADDGLRMPSGVFHFSDQISVSRGLTGQGRQLTRLVYTGPPRPDGAIAIKGGSWGYKLEGFDLACEQWNDPPRREGVGIAAGWEAVSGTQSGGAVWERVSVNGFDVGTSLGRFEGGATSEILFQCCEWSQCNTAVQCDQWNTLNLIFTLPGFTACGVGLDGGRAGSIHVTGGAAREVTGSVFIFRSGGTFSVRGFRAEGCGYLLDTGTTTATMSIAVENCQTTGMNRTHPENSDIAVAWGAALSVRDCILEGSVYYGPTDETANPAGFGSVVLENVRTRGPVLLDSRVGARLRHSVRNCALLNDGGEVAKRLDCEREIFGGPVC